MNWEMSPCSPSWLKWPQTRNGFGLCHPTCVLQQAEKNNINFAFTPFTSPHSHAHIHRHYQWATFTSERGRNDPFRSRTGSHTDVRDEDGGTEEQKEKKRESDGRIITYGREGVTEKCEGEAKIWLIYICFNWWLWINNRACINTEYRVSSFQIFLLHDTSIIIIK